MIEPKSHRMLIRIEWKPASWKKNARPINY